MEFADIALVKLLQTIPELEKYILTFQDVTHELPEEAGLNVGVFVLRAGADYFFIPVIEKAENVYPIDSIFFESTGKFFPLTPKTAALVAASSQVSQGKPVKTPDNVTKNPSVYNLINPPRTGKHVYASASRLTEFLAQLPQHIKEAAADQISGEKSVYDKLDEMFGLKALFSVLRAADPVRTGAPGEAPAVMVVTGPQPGQTPEQKTQLMQQGYYVVGQPSHTRIAVQTSNYNKTGSFTTVTSLDGDRDHTIVLRNSDAREAYIPKLKNTSGRKSLALFTDGSYAFSESFVTTGAPLVRRQVLTTLFGQNPPCLLKDVYRDDVIVLVLNTGEFVGPFRVRTAAVNSLGSRLSVTDYAGDGTVNIMGYRTFNKTYEKIGDDIIVPSSTQVFKLGENRTLELERSAEHASKRRDVIDLQFLGDELNLAFDGVEFFANGKAVGSEPALMRRLVEVEGLAPDNAESFVKQARELKSTKIYMTKRAFSTDAAPAETPTYGHPAPQNGKVGLDGSFIKNVQNSLSVNDAQVAEATVISELLQTPDMGEMITEYLPDIEEALDKLGRIMFLSRLNIAKLAEAHDPESVYSFLTSLRNVYRQLGESFIKLQEMAAISSAESRKAPGK